MNKPFQFTKLFPPKEEITAKGNQWPKQDLIKYAVYLNFQQNIKQSQSDIDFNSWSFFRQLSIFIQSKNPNQCRIFHKRMMSDHSSITTLLSGLKSSIHKFQEWEKHYQLCLMNIKACLKRERDQIQKQLPSKKATGSDLSIIFYPKGLQQDKVDIQLDKDQKQLGPTGLDYQDGDLIKPSNLQVVKQKERPSLSFCMQEQQSILQDDLSLFDPNANSGFFTITKEKSTKNQRFEEMVRDCQNSFQNYLVKLNSLSSLTDRSFEDY